MGSSQVMGPRGASTGDLELPAPRPSPAVASFPPLARSERGQVTARAPGGGLASGHLSSADSLS